MTRLVDVDVGRARGLVLGRWVVRRRRAGGEEAVVAVAGPPAHAAALSTSLEGAERRSAGCSVDNGLCS